MGGLLDWCFRDRTTGRIVVGQWPNPPLWIFAAAVVIRTAFQPAGAAGSALLALQAGALLWWALDELLRGVNPWRRALGAAALLFLAVSAVASREVP